jgi:hypothetical protein
MTLNDNNGGDNNGLPLFFVGKPTTQKAGIDDNVLLSCHRWMLCTAKTGKPNRG